MTSTEDDELYNDSVQKMLSPVLRQLMTIRQVKARIRLYTTRPLQSRNFTSYLRKVMMKMMILPLFILPMFVRMFHTFPYNL